MSKEEMREGFEAWHCEQYKTKHTTGAPTRDLHGGVYDEKYGPPKQQALWECWQETGGDVAKVEALKEEIERVEAGKQPVAGQSRFTSQKDWQPCSYEHHLMVIANPSEWPGYETRALFTRSDAGEVERLRAELGECKGEYDRAVNKVDALRDQLTAMCNLWPEDMRNEGPGIGFMQHVIDTVNAARSALPAIAKPACKTCHDQGEVFVSKGKVEYGMLTEPDPIYIPCPDCAEPANKEG